MKPEKRKLVSIFLLILCGMIVCMFFMFRHSPHRSAFTLTFYGLMLANAWIQYTESSKRRTPSTLIRLFPDHPETSKENT